MEGQSAVWGWSRDCGLFLKTAHANFISSYVFQVAVKVLRSSSGTSREKVTKVGINFLQKKSFYRILYQRLRREIEVWKRLSHKNIVPLFGIAANFESGIGMVSPWMDNRDLNFFLSARSTTLTLSDRFRLVSAPLNNIVTQAKCRYVVAL